MNEQRIVRAARMRNYSAFSLSARAHLLFVALAWPFLANAQTTTSTKPLLSAPTYVAVGDNPSAVITTDFNRDGIPDLVVANRNSNTVTILPGNGSGGFGTPTTLFNFTTPSALAVGDFNRDGAPDLIVARATPGVVSVVLNDGSGGIEGGVPYVVGDAPASIAVADFDRDGFPDMVVANSGSSNVTIRFGNGTEDFPFGPPDTISVGGGTTPQAVAVCDVNNDGRPDIVVANGAGNDIAVLVNQGGGGSAAFTTATRLALSGNVSRNGLVVADVNRDGTADVITINGNNTITVLPNVRTTNGYILGPSTSYNVGTAPTGAAVEDFNADGIPDIVVANSTGQSLQFLRGTTNGGFDVLFTFNLSTQPSALALADLNRDGRPDIVMANGPTDNLTIYQNANPAYSGPPQFSAPSTFTSSGYQPYDVAVGDLDQNGFSDLAILYFDLPQQMYTFSNNGAGGFTGSGATAATGRAISVADFNGDGKPEPLPGISAVGDVDRDGKLDVAYWSGNAVTIGFGNGTGGYASTEIVASENFPRSPILHDFDNDGDLDLAYVNQGSNDLDEVVVHLNDGNGSFSPWRRIEVGGNPVNLVAGDFDRDGKLDLAVALYTWGQAVTLRGKGDGDFESPATVIAYGSYAFDVGIADLTGDGKPDLVVAYSTFVEVLAGDGNGGFAAPHNRSPGGIDLIGMAFADFNRDGKLDLVTASFVELDDPTDFSVLYNQRSALSIVAPPSVGVFGETYSGVLSVTGTSGAFTFALAPGSALPTGLMLNGTTGTLTGTPTGASGNHSFDIVATDSALGLSVRQTFRVYLTGARETIPNAVIGSYYDQPIVPAPPLGGGHFLRVHSGTLPPGLSVGGGNRTYGYAQEPGTYDVVIERQSFTSPSSTYDYFARRITVVCPQITFTVTNLPDATLHQPYSGPTLTATGGEPFYNAKFQFFFDGGDLPPLMTVSTNGLISGTPYIAGLHSFNMRAVDFWGGCSAVRPYQLRIAGLSAPLADDLTAWYRAEGNANSYPTGHNGTVVGNVSFPFVRGRQAFQFDGAGSYVALPANAFPYPTSGTNSTPFTFETWFKTTNSGVILGQQSVAPFGTPTGSVPAIYVGLDGKLRAEMFWKGAVAQIFINKIVNDGAFHHVAVIFNGSFMTAFFDGSAHGIIQFKQVAYGTGTYFYQLGTGFSSSRPSTPGGWFHFKGIIDGAAIYPRVLEPEEIGMIFRAGGIGKSTRARVTSFAKNGSNVAVKLNTWPSLRFQLQHTTTLDGNWTDVGTPQQSSTGGVVNFSTTNPAPNASSGFFRAQEVP